MKHNNYSNIVSRVLPMLLLVAILAGCKSNVEKIQEVINDKNACCPLVITKGLTLDTISLDSVGVIYNITVDTVVAKKIPFGAFVTDSAKIQSGFYDRLIKAVENDSDRDFIEMCANEGLSIIYRYRNFNHTDSVEVTIPAVNLLPLTETSDSIEPDTTAVKKNQADTTRR